MSQGGLFAAEPLVIVDDDHGRFAYESAVIPASLADAWFATLLAEIPWQAQRREMYGRDSVAPHNDHIEEIAEGPRISLAFRLRSGGKVAKHRR